MSETLHDDVRSDSKGWHSSAETVTSRAKWYGRMLVISGMTFNCLLCFLATRGLPIGLPVIVGTELLIIILGVLLVLFDEVEFLSRTGIFVTLWLGVLLCSKGAADLKIGPEILMLTTFFLIGKKTATPKDANYFLWFAALLILFVGLFEYFMQESFEYLFNIFRYYVGKGALNLTQEFDTGTTLAENGIRPIGEGRELLPGLLNLHRIGSVFLEPISVGNFTTICTAWVFARGYFRLESFLLVFVGLVIGVFADNRFAIFSSVAVALVLLTPAWRSRLLVGGLPVITVLGLMAYGASGQGGEGNSFAGRLYGSGALLDRGTLLEWLGFASPDRISLDTGYSYLFGNLGVVATAILWTAVVVRGEKNDVSKRFFAAISIYGSLSLSISESSLSIKTAALLWYLYGALQNNDTSSRAPLSRRPKSPAMEPANG